MPMSQINTFMSNGAINEDAEDSEFERGAWSFVARSQRGRCRDYIGTRTGPFAAASLSVSGASTHGSSSDTPCRTIRTSDVQNPSRCTRTIAGLFCQQRFDAERDCHPRSRKVSDRGASASLIWSSDQHRRKKFVWNSLLIVCFLSSCTKSMACWWWTTFAH
jgi:hypothetical protein